MSNVMAIHQNAQSASLVPASMGEAFQLAEMMAKSKLVPGAFQGKAEDCMLVVMQAVRWNMDPFAVIQECSVIQGKLMYSGKLVAAVVNARGNLVDRLAYKPIGSAGAPASLSMIVSGRIAGEKEPRTIEVRWADAKTVNQQWTKQPEQQLSYHGARVWARRHTPELMLGVYSPEEFDAPETARDVTPPPQVKLAPLTAPVLAAPVDPETGEIGPHAIELKTNGEKVDWVGFTKAFGAALNAADSAGEIDAWHKANVSTLGDMTERAPKMLAAIMGLTQQRLVALEQTIIDAG